MVGRGPRGGGDPAGRRPRCGGAAAAGPLVGSHRPHGRPVLGRPGAAPRARARDPRARAGRAGPRQGALTMAIVQALLAAVARSAGRVLNTVFGWATVMIFGRVPESRQIYLSVIAFGSVVWI